MVDQVGGLLNMAQRATLGAQANQHQQEQPQVKLSEFGKQQSIAEAQINFQAKQILVFKTKELIDAALWQGEFQDKVQFDENSLKMQQMGFEKEIADFCLASTGFNSIERACGYKYEEESGKLIHQYIAGLFGCYLCERDADQHQNIEGQNNDSTQGLLINEEQVVNNGPQGKEEAVKRQRIMTEVALKIQKESEIQKASDKNENDDVCTMCYDNLSTYTEEQLFSFDCKHTFHAECVQTSFSDFIQRGEITNLTCLNGCNKEKPVKASIEQLKVLFKSNPEIVKRLEMLTDKRKLESDPLMRYCPQPKCDGMIQALSKDDKKLACPTCKKNMCFQCKEDWHEGSCYENSKKLLKELGGDISTCPVCNVKVERTKGCNKMLCTYCGNSYCWECGQSIKDYKHFQGNGCGAKTFGARNSIVNNEAVDRIKLLIIAICCGWIIIPAIAAVFVWCFLACFAQCIYCPKDKQKEERKNLVLYFISFFISLGGMCFVYYLWYKTNWKLVFINIGLIVPFLCCWLCFVFHKPYAGTKEELAQEAKQIREEAEKKRDGIITQHHKLELIDEENPMPPQGIQERIGNIFDRRNIP